MKSSTRLRRLFIGAMLMTCLTLGMLTGSASAVLSMDTSTDTEVTVDSDSHWWQSASRPITYGGYQYIGSWDAEEREGVVYLQLTRRRLSDGNRVTLRFDTEPYIADFESGIQDGHNAVGLGLSPNDGTIHMVWSLHNSDRRMRYWYSNTRCMERTQEEFTAANCDFRRRFYMAERRVEEQITYPTFINDQRDRLWFTQRNDASSRADQYIDSYNESTQTWSLLGKIIRGRRSVNEGGFPERRREEAGTRENEFRWRFNGNEYRSVERGIYIAGIAFDKNDRMHVAWAWRENASGMNKQHGLNYAYSDRSTEYRDWYSQSGTRMGTAASEPIDINDLAQSEAISAPPGALYFGNYMALDAYNNPHIVSGSSDVLADDFFSGNTRVTHYWRDTEGTWYSQFIDESREGVDYEIFPSLFFDRGNVMYGVVGRTDLEFGPFNGSEASGYVYNYLQPDHVTWQPDGERDGFLDVQVYSEETFIDSAGPIEIPISTEGNNQVRVRMRNDTSATDFYVGWATAERPSFAVEMEQTFRGRLVARDRNYSEYTFTITDPEWRGTLTAIEIGPGLGATSGGSSIDWIKITNSAGTAAKTWEFTRGFKLYGFEASPADNWSTWTREELLPDVQVAAGDGTWSMDRQRYAREKVLDFLVLAQGRPGVEALTMREFDITGDDVAMEVRFDTDKVGWSAQRDVESFRWSNDGGTKGVTGTLTGIDSQIISPINLKIPLGETTGDNVHVRLKNSTAATRAKLYFITDADRTWNETKAIEFTITARSGYTLYNIDMSRVSGWRNNTLYQLRLDPANDATTRSGTFNVDRIYVADT